MATAAPRYTIEAATEWGIGTGWNGTGRREKVSGFYVVDTKQLLLARHGWRAVGNCRHA